MIKKGKYDEAKAVCQTLREQYPNQIDGLHRSAELFEAMEDYSKAVTFYKLTADFAEQADGFGKEAVEFFRNKAEQLASVDK